jgi:hypothetical protein
MTIERRRAIGYEGLALVNPTESSSNKPLFATLKCWSDVGVAYYPYYLEPTTLDGR